MIKRRGKYFLNSISTTGLILGAIMFVLSLTPSLLPRAELFQGILSGACFVIGYVLGLFTRWLWNYLELPVDAPENRRRRLLIAAPICALAVMLALWRTKYWQNSVRLIMEMEPIDSAQLFRIALIAALTIFVLMTLGKMIKSMILWISSRMNRWLPPRLANVLAVVGAAYLLVFIANGVIAHGIMRMADASFQMADAIIPPTSRPPRSPMKTGSRASLIAWHELGLRGREFISGGITASEIRAFTGQGAMEPIRVYAGLNAAETPSARARLALRELKRVNAFSRAALVVITPTGTGWVDPAAIDSLEYLYRGDVASVALQYSYLPSHLSVFVDASQGEETARALFTEIYGYWTGLPEHERPKLYLHGLSLGALHSERSVDMFEILRAPPAGALWSGPTFANRSWRYFTDARNPDSPAWLPEFRDGGFVRFMNQNGSSISNDAPWGPMRVVYLQYASDAVTFFHSRYAYHKPDWMSEPRGPDVSPSLRWYPIVTMLQLAFDVLIARDAPLGYGHSYSPAHYIDAWMLVAGIDDWTVEDILRLKEKLTSKRLREIQENIGG